MGIFKSGMDKTGFWLILVSILLAGCNTATIPTLASTTIPTPTLDAFSTPMEAMATVPQPTVTPDPELIAMIVNPTGFVTNVHDPTMIKAGSMYYLVSTGPGIPIRCSKDMKVWESCGRVFNANPDWVVKAIQGVQDLWAPDIVFHNSKYYLYYAASTFGSNRSAIGLVTNTTLDPKSPEYAWVDQGEVLSSQRSDNYNALDPNLAFDKDGQPWLVFGSFWSGIKLVKVDPATLKPVAGEALISLASRPSPDAIEGAFITRRGDFYYLFISHDFCCKGVQSTYNIKVGRAQAITGPYLDQDGQRLTQDGGTPVYQGSIRWRGPGHNSIYIEDGTYYMVYHAYDANAGGIPTLRIEALKWDSDGWPQSPSALSGK